MSPAHDALSQLVSVTPRAVISCNSWAYQFVQTFDDLAAHLGPCLTMPAFDATALAALMRQTTQLAKDQSQFPWPTAACAKRPGWKTCCASKTS